MKPVRLKRNFEKHFKQRIVPNAKLVTQYKTRVELFVSGERNYPLDDHVLTGKMRGKRSFSVAGDIRVVYVETDEAFVFLDIGSHNQVYK